MATAGERIKEETKVYCGIYDDLCDVPTLKDKAENIALADPLIKKYIWSEVEKNVRKYIESRQ